MSSMESVLRKVRALIDRAEHPETPKAEAESARAKADKLMTDYAIEQAQLNESRPQAQQVRPGHFEIEICEAGSPYEPVIVLLTQVVAQHCRCQTVFRNLASDSELVRAWRDAYNAPLKCKAVVFGFEADREYFNMLFTVLHLHMANGFDPKPDTSLTDGQNAYNLHNAGLNWRSIARMFYRIHEMGWDGTHNENNWQRYGNYWRSQYNAEIRRLGESPVVLPKFSDSGDRLISYRYSFARSYVSVIDRRLTEIRNGRQVGGELVLRSATEKINEAIAEMFPELKSTDWKSKRPEINERAWAAGKIHGENADLDVSTKMGGAARPELG